MSKFNIAVFEEANKLATSIIRDSVELTESQEEMADQIRLIFNSALDHDADMIAAGFCEMVAEDMGSVELAARTLSILLAGHATKLKARGLDDQTIDLGYVLEAGRNINGDYSKIFSKTVQDRTNDLLRAAMNGGI